MLALLLSLVCPPQSPAPRTPPPQSIADRYRTFDLDQDGIAEIWSVTHEESLSQDAPRNEHNVLILVEPRLIEPAANRRALALRLAIGRFAHDVARDNGGAAFVFATTVHAGQEHQDGLTLLALRRFAQDVARTTGGLSGIVLIGAFPEALLVRTCNWWRDDPITLRAGTDRARTHQEVRWLRSHPEIVAHTADVVLGDLDGAWEGRYRKGPVDLRWQHCIPAEGADTGDTATFALRDFDTGTFAIADFFAVDDGTVHVTATGNGWLATPRPLLRDHECSPRDRRRGNPLAVPDVWVSRVNARGVAFLPRRELRDERGQPRATDVPADVQSPHWWHGNWVHDLGFERRLLLSWFERNHAYRTGELRPPRRPASLACGLGSGMRELQNARAAWPELDPALDVAGEPDLVAVARWFGAAAELRTLRAHSDPWGAAFAGRTDIGALERAIGGTPWAFTLEHRQLRPSLHNACGGGKLDFFLLRTLWENGITGSSAAFYVHTGCEAISPPGAVNLPWSDPGYGAWGGGNAVLFFGDGLALVGRAKVFYDEPREFAATLRDGRTFGAAWQRYFEIESAATDWAQVGDDIGRKRCYFWSVLGDGSLRLQP